MTVSRGEPEHPQLPVGSFVRYVGHKNPKEFLCDLVNARAGLHGRVGQIRQYHFVIPHVQAGRYEHTPSHFYDVAFSVTAPVVTVPCCDHEIEPVD